MKRALRTLLALSLLVLIAAFPLRAAPIHDAAKNGDREEVVRLLQSDRKLVNARDEAHGNTPLHWAAYRGHMSAAVELMAYGADVNAKNNDGYTPLRDAAYKGHVKIVESLLRHGARVDEKDRTYGATALHWAANASQDKGQAEIIGLLMFLGADPRAKDKEGKTPIDWASSNGSKDAVRLLSRTKGTYLLASQVNEFFDALCRNDVTKVKALAAKTPALVKAREAGIPGGQGFTALHFAAERGNREIAEFLIEKGADVNATGVTTSDFSTEGFTPLHCAAFDGAVEVADLLISKGARVFALDTFGRTPLHIAAFRAKKDMLALLLSKRANIGAKTKEGETVLHEVAATLDVMARRGISEDELCQAAAFLIEKGAPLNEKDRYGTTPLMAATKNRHKKLAEVIRTHGGR
ncbi:MAG: ankyrin repeat domain-containing protein [Candidatus Eremiobacteraeota bacterium]|nr:ankyrin repeat domain-containing protein [Candidatus Eremiobacteraeota bacterium]